MKLTRYDPRTLDVVPDFLDRWFEEFPAFSRHPATLDGRWFPAADVYETKDAFVIETDLPEIEPKDLELKVEDGTLMLHGERKFKRETKQEDFYRMERREGAFTRRFVLPDGVDTDKVTAKYDKGVLKITMPKTEPKPRNVRSIKVN